MKRLLLTVAVAALALAPNAFANKVGGGGNKPAKPVVESKEQEAKRIESEKQSTSAGTARQESTRESIGARVIVKSGTGIRGVDAQKASKNIAKVLASDAEARTAVDILIKNTNEASTTSLAIIAELARQDLLGTPAGLGMLKFIRTQIAAEIAKGNDSVGTVQLMVSSIKEVSLLLREAAVDGKSIDARAAVGKGLENTFDGKEGRPKKTKEEIEEILCKCFGIC